MTRDLHVPKDYYVGVQKDSIGHIGPEIAYLEMILSRTEADFVDQLS